MVVHVCQYSVLHSRFPTHVSAPLVGPVRCVIHRWLFMVSTHPTQMLALFQRLFYELPLPPLIAFAMMCCWMVVVHWSLVHRCHFIYSHWFMSSGGQGLTLSH